MSIPPPAPIAVPLQTQPDVAAESTTRLAPLYRILIHNDDLTSMDFVIMVLTTEFRKELPESRRIMLEAHRHGVALVSVLPLEEAEFRVERAHALARTAKFPLRFSYEPAE